MRRLEEMNVGKALQPIELAPVSRLDLIKYAGASGDFNPIHTIDKDAEKVIDKILQANKENITLEQLIKQALKSA